MKYHKIILAGGSGQLGKALADHYKDVAEQVIILSRTSHADNENIKTLVWDGRMSGPWAKELEGADLLINLCGKNVNCRYTKQNREEIIRSRVEPTRLLGKVIDGLINPPKLWINAASATIYRHAEDRPQDEETGEIGYGFSIDVCKKWENTFFDIPTPHTRKVALRISIVLSHNEGAFPRLVNLVKTGMGGHQGDGQQYVSWVHEQDVVKCTEWLLQHPEMKGVINCTAPNPLKNTDLMKQLRHACGIPFGLPAPAWMLEIGAALIGTETELILKSRWVVPKRLLDAGFQFQFAKAEHAIKDILSISI
ncbi:TIGR01777 family protein [Mucilaginibacter sp. 14171R-50]|uniref:TIGR01777 family oxidoreductase n=1 Tax=Mucilaginibacter sp. 14171R-50 TaxID=2703789 RepID=UPI00138CA851|nr:TIGR01777 family oxidoreductase [Mucilaginibacter sp. 14171R-50]QHS55622.1 TIGR01777 family protein [Mucilaginibacter sp. 14171R-50]